VAPVAELIRMPVDGPFSLATATAFEFGPSTTHPHPDDQAMRLAFVTDDLQHQAGAVIRQEPGGDLTAEITGVTDIAAAERQVRRILSVDRPAAGWIAAGRRDPVLGRLQERHHGLRPVLFRSPYETAAWAMIAQRRHKSQARALWHRLAGALGRPFELAGQVRHAFPAPERLTGLETFPGLEPRRIERLHGVADRALAGELDPERLAAMNPDQAIAALRAVPGLGPVYAGLVYLRSTGVADALTLGEPRIPHYVRHYYGLTGTDMPGTETLSQIAESWRPFRTWAAVLIRVAGDRDGLPWRAERAEAMRPERRSPDQAGR
jgi:DNA-3-methyladenine glycosylase II